MNELATKKENNLQPVTNDTELQQAHAVASAQHQIQSAIAIAKRFPRDEPAAVEMIKKACQRKGFAEKAIYAYPRAGATVEGASVNIAREMARCWGNLWIGTEIIRDDAGTRLVRAYAWDLETGTRKSQDVQFAKLIQRKGRDGKTLWIEPDERDLNELTNRNAAKAERNVILSLVPSDIKEDALALCKTTLKKTAKVEKPEELSEAINKMQNAFFELNVTKEMIEKKVGHPTQKITPEELETLRGLYIAIKEGETTAGDHFDLPSPDEAQSKTEELKGRLFSK